MSLSNDTASEIIASAGSCSRDSLRIDNEFAMYGDAFPSEGEIFFDDLDEGGQTKAISFGGTVPAALEIARGDLSSLSVGHLESAFAFIDTMKSKSSYSCSPSAKLPLPSPKPLILLPNHFKVEKNSQVVMSVITKLFDDQYRNDICYALDPYECLLEGVYLRGSRYSDFSFRLYEDGPESLIIEGQRLDRESCGQTFRTVYDAVKRAVGMTVSPTSTIDAFDPVYGIYDPSAIELTGASSPSDEEITETMRVMLSMLGNKSYSTQLEGAKMLCDLSQDETYRQRMAECGCVHALVTLLRDKNQYLQHHLRQQIVLTLAQLSCCHQCALEMVETGLLLILMAPIYSNSDFKTAGYCREAARIIANVSSKLGPDAVKNISREDLHGWIARIEDIEDKEIKAACERAKHSIQPSKGWF
jgi:hypothetical protein